MRETAARLWHWALHTDPCCITSVLQKFESISGGGHLFSWEKVLASELFYIYE